MIIGLYKISGHSMNPTYKPQDVVFVSMLPYLFSKPKRGDVVLYRKDSKVLIKRISHIENGLISVTGDNKRDSLPLDRFKSNLIMAKVVFKI